MGREASCEAQIGSERADVRALLESTEVILRGGVRRRYPVGALRGLRVDGEHLRFAVADEAVALLLGSEEAARWLKKLNTPAPTLAAKLGISPASPAWMQGRVDDAALAQALQGASTTQAAQASVVLAVASSAAELAAALQAHVALPTLPLWIIHPKGKGASLADAEVRATLRAAGYMDNKTTAVSDALTATRYRRR